jgi:hypothetical protein
MSRTLVWKNDAADPVYRDSHIARTLTAVHGQYAIWPSRDGGFRVSNRKFSTTTGELSEQVIGSADTLDQAKAIAQAHADQHARKKPTAV